MEEPRAAFESVAFEHLPALHRHALRLTRKEADADDLVQEAMLKAFRAYHQFTPGTNFKAWIFRILVNSYINRYRRREREPIPVDFTEMEPMAAGLGAGGLTVTDIGQLKDQVSDEVKEGLDAMPEDYRMVFLLSVLDEFAYHEIAEILGIPIGTVMSRLFRARKHMRSRLETYAAEIGFSQGEIGE
jgi:RNA polymerase sigma-70 factor (ECF subfamily)